jgi:hypothetical protein
MYISTCYLFSGRGSNKFSQLTRERLNANSNDSHQVYDNYHSTPNRSYNQGNTNDNGEYSPNSPANLHSPQRGRGRGRNGNSEYKDSDDYNSEIYGDDRNTKNYDDNNYESNVNSNRNRGGGGGAISEEDLQDIFRYLKRNI